MQHQVGGVKITRLWQIMWERLFRNMMIDYFPMIPQDMVYSIVYIKWYHLITGSYQIRAVAKSAVLPKRAMQFERTCEPKYTKG